MGIKGDFKDAYCGKSGVVEGGDGAMVRLIAVSLTTFCPPEWYVKEFGCPAGQFAILAQYVPAEPTDRVAPVVFPRTFDGTPVYYKAGSANVAASGS